VDLTARLVSGMDAAAVRPRVLVSASAVGYYGDRGDDVLTEDSVPSSDATGSLAEDWEAAAISGRRLGVRVVLLRIGVVLGLDGGMLQPLLPLFKLGLGGPQGSGAQYLPWVHLHDLTRMIVAALADDRYDGPVNAVSPAPVTNRAFARQLGAVLRRPAVLTVPAFVLRAVLGPSARLVTGGQRAAPARLHALGFTWSFPELEAALRDVVSTADVDIRPITAANATSDVPDHPYLRARPPRFELRTTTVVPAPVEETFRFFSDARNLGLITPRAMKFRIQGAPPAIATDAVIAYRLRVGPFPVRWRSRIVNWAPPRRFVDIQETGPYRCWWHEHAFRDEHGATVMTDRVLYAAPFGVVGRVMNRFVIAPSLRRIFSYRRGAIHLRFGRR
jgi:hypothetical protein